MDAPQEAASKSVEGERVKRLTNFCPTTKYSMFVANMCGKDDIGISAVGQKVFLACTQYFNNELKRIVDTRGIITKEDIERSPIYVKKAFEFYRRRLNNKNESITKSVLVISETLANITTNNSVLDQRVKDIFNEIAAVKGTKIINEFDVGNNLKEGEGDYDIYDYVDNLTERKFEDDQSIVISSLISASTDNAKELILDKINANPEFMPIYIYLVTKGIDFSDISDLMTSDLMYKIKRLVNSNRLYNENVSLDSVITRIDSGGVPLNTFIDYQYYSGVITFLESFPSEIKGKKNKIAEKIKKLPKENKGKLKEVLSALNADDYKIILNAIKNNDIALTKFSTGKNLSAEDEFIEEMMFEEIGDIEGYYHNDKTNHRRDFIRWLEVSIPYKEIYDDLNRDDSEIRPLYTTFKSAHQGAKQLTLLGRVFGLNGGMKTDLYDRYAFSKVFNDLAQPMLEQLMLDLQDGKSIDRDVRYLLNNSGVKSDETIKSDFNFDIHAFLNDPRYQRGAIILGEYDKHVGNAFDIILKLPHYYSFLKAFDLNEMNQKLTSIKYKILKDIINDYENQFGTSFNLSRGKFTKNQFKNILSYIDELIVSKFLTYPNSKLSFQLRAGDKYFADGKLTTAVDNMVISLNSDDAVASFKYYIENKVIPYLRNGQIIDLKGDIKEVSILRTNEFINRLILTQEKNITTGIPYTYYRSSINAFNTENNIEYDKQVTAFSAIEDLTFEGQTLGDLFFIYDLIINKGKPKQGSLFKILRGTSYDDNSVYAKFYRFIGEADYNTLDNIDPNKPHITKDDINYHTLAMYIAFTKGSKNANGSKSEYVKIYDKDSDTYTLQRKVAIDQNNKKKITYEDIELKDQDYNYYVLNTEAKELEFSINIPSDSNINIINKLKQMMTGNLVKLLFEC